MNKPQPIHPEIPTYKELQERIKELETNPQIPEGYALVPIIPTEEMIEAGVDSSSYSYNAVYENQAMQIYKAMLSAAPKP